MDPQDLNVQAPDQWCLSAFSPGGENCLTFSMYSFQTICTAHVDYWMGPGRAFFMQQSPIRELCFEILSSPVQRDTFTNAFENEAAVDGFAEFLLSLPRVDTDQLSVSICGTGEHKGYRPLGSDFWKFLGLMKVITALRVSLIKLSCEGDGRNFCDAIQALDRPAPHDEDGQEYQGLSQIIIDSVSVGRFFMDNLASGLRNMTHLEHVKIRGFLGHCPDRGEVCFRWLDSIVPALKAGSSATLSYLLIDNLKEANSLASLGMDFPALSTLWAEFTSLTNIKLGLHQNTTIQCLKTQAAELDSGHPNIFFPWEAEFNARNKTLKQLNESSSLLMSSVPGEWSKCVHHLAQPVRFMRGREAVPVRSSALFQFLRETVIPQHFAPKNDKSTESFTWPSESNTEKQRESATNRATQSNTLKCTC